MRNLFFDANVIIDFLATREPFSTDAAFLFELAEKNKIRIFVSSVSFNVIYYILRQKIGNKATISLLNDLASLVEISDVTSFVIVNAILHDNVDFEDSIQYCTALNNPEIQAIITRDPKGYKKSKLPVFSPHEILKNIK